MTPVTPSDAIRSTPVGSFVHVEDLPGTDSARWKAASRAVARGELLPVRRGLYYRGRSTRYGMTGPSPFDVVIEVVGSRGVGPSGYSAAQAWGVTTQVPPALHVATLKTVDEIDGVKQTLRNNLERADLSALEIALLELLRDPDIYVEAGWPALVAAVRTACASGAVRVENLSRAVRGERNASVRQHFTRLKAEAFNTTPSGPGVQGEGPA